MTNSKGFGITVAEEVRITERDVQNDNKRRAWNNRGGIFV
ncbi:hypothetical protein BMS3Abin07_00606 [bacterium BMS3Abin07]|nr:hypothetical protein BMS3Abin07_00606 [bacterium BMS3Abin07]